MRKPGTLSALSALLICGCLPAATAGGAVRSGVATQAVATENATLTASFSPDRFGASTTIGFGFSLSTTNGLAPPPMTSVDLHMPAGMNYTGTTLGLATCRPKTLEEKGLAGCPANSRLGSGSAYVEVPFGTGSGHELPEIQAVTGPAKNGNMVVLFYANGQAPVSAQLVFEGVVLPDSGPFGSQLSTLVPPVPSVPDGPDVSIVSMSATIGPKHLTYYKYVHGKRVPFHPIGIAVPEKCPRRGFLFTADFGFMDGSTAKASTTIPCPPPSRRRHK